MNTARRLGVRQFSNFFVAIHGVNPYPWQERLAARALAGDWPSALHLPAGVGKKTAVMDVAVFALAARPDITPRRCVIVVNDATSAVRLSLHAQQIVDKLTDEDGTPAAVGLVAAALKETLRSEHIPVMVNGIGTEQWVQTPHQPWITVTTVDQFASDLLFRSQLASPKEQPIRAGLLGNDCLIVLDDTPPNSPMLSTLGAIEEHWKPRSLGVRRYQVITLSASASDTELAQDSDILTLDRTDIKDRSLGPLLTAPTKVHLKKVDWAPPASAVTQQVMQISSSLGTTERCVGIIVSNFHRVHSITRSLRGAGHTVYLGTGSMRPLDRQTIAEHIDSETDPNREAADNQPKDKVFVVTSSSAAVADISFDALITEVAPIDVLCRRLGTVDRRGVYNRTTGRSSRAWIIGPSSKKRSTIVVEDRACNDATLNTWFQLLKLGGRRGLIDGCPVADTSMFGEDTRTPQRTAPLLLPHHLDALAQTNPEPGQLPPADIAAFGLPDDGSVGTLGNVYIVWRFDRSRAALEAVPVRPAELMSLPYRVAYRWLRQLEQRHGSSKRRPWRILWYRQGGPPIAVSRTRFVPGNVIVVSPSAGGIVDGNWHPTSWHWVTDVGDAAQHLDGDGKHRYTLRLDKRLYPDLPAPPEPSEADLTDSAILTDASGRISKWLSDVSRDSDRLPEWMDTTIRHFIRYPFAVRRDISGHYWILSSPSTVISTRHRGKPNVVTLREHHDTVAATASDYSRSLGLPPPLASDMVLAAQLHDIGKASARYQQQLFAGKERLLLLHTEPLAAPWPGTSSAVQPGNWPPIYHEFVSVGLVEESPFLREQAHDPDLVLHLIGSHHGRARPLPLLRSDPNPETVTYQYDGHTMNVDTATIGPRFAIEMSERYWRLTDRYGHHGLVWLETIIRLAIRQRTAGTAGR